MTWTGIRRGTTSALSRRMDKILSYRDLECWQQAMDLALLVYKLTKPYPEEERFGLTFHTRKTAVGSLEHR